MTNLHVEEVEDMLRVLADRHPKLVARSQRSIPLDELIWVLQSLLDEGVSISRLEVILEVLLDRPVQPLAAVRVALAPEVVGPHTDHESTIQVIGILPFLERQLVRGNFRLFLEQLSVEIKSRREKPVRAVLLCRPEIRFRVRRLLRPIHPDLPVISWNELPKGVNLNSVALLRTKADDRAKERLFDRFRAVRARARK